MDAEQAVRNAHEWFEHNSGWAPPDEDTLAEWVADGVCRCPDECLVAPDGWCEHGLASWALILAALAREDARSQSPEWLAPKDAAAQLGITLQALYRLIDQGDLRGRRAERRVLVSAQDVRRWRGDDGGGAVPVR